MRRTVLLCLLLLAFGSYVTMPSYGDIDLHDLRLEYLSKKDGLSSPYITSIFQDHHGFIWIGTDEGGLNRFDGYTFLHYRRNREDSGSISSDRITETFEDSSGILWVATKNAGLNSLNRDTGTFTLYLHNPNNTSDIPHNRIRDIYEDSRRNL